MPAKQTFADRKEQNTKMYEEKRNHGIPKTGKFATTRNYEFVLPKELEGVPGISSITVKALTMIIESGFKEFQYGPLKQLFCQRLRGDELGTKDPYINVTGFSKLFVDIEEIPFVRKITWAMRQPEARHDLNDLAVKSGKMYQDLEDEIAMLTPETVLLIINNAWKFSGKTGIAVPVFYYLAEDDQLLVNQTRYLDHADNIPEAQFKLENGLTKNRPWAVWPEHMEAYERLKAEVAAKKAEKEAEKARKKAEADQRFAEMGEDHGTDEELAEKLAAARALMQGKKPPGAV